MEGGRRGIKLGRGKRGRREVCEGGEVGRKREMVNICKDKITLT